MQIAVMIVGRPLVAPQENGGTEGLVRWRAWPELDRSDLSMLQGRTQAQASCQREQLPWWVTVKQVIVIDRLSMESKLAQVNAGKIHAAGSGPSGLGMMQPKGRPQQGKLKT